MYTDWRENVVMNDDGSEESAALKKKLVPVDQCGVDQLQRYHDKSFPAGPTGRADRICELPTNAYDEPDVLSEQVTQFL